jgi:hypothetical protein
MSGSKIARGGGVVFSALLALFAIGCPSENVGGIKQSQDVARAFETLAVFPNYRYYFLNQENDPFGVAGLERGYWIEDPSWREVAPSSTTFEKVVGLVQSFPVPGKRTEGYTIVDPQGRQIGVWYSSLGAGVTIDPDTRKVSIATAQPWLSQ